MSLHYSLWWDAYRKGVDDTLELARQDYSPTYIEQVLLAEAGETTRWSVFDRDYLANFLDGLVANEDFGGAWCGTPFVESLRALAIRIRSGDR